MIEKLAELPLWNGHFARRRVELALPVSFTPARTTASSIESLRFTRSIRESPA
jgi:hypothetical protein